MTTNNFEGGNAPGVEAESMKKRDFGALYTTLGVFGVFGIVVGMFGGFIYISENERQTAWNTLNDAVKKDGFTLKGDTVDVQGWTSIDLSSTQSVSLGENKEFRTYLSYGKCLLEGVRIELNQAVETTSDPASLQVDYIVNIASATGDTGAKYQISSSADLDVNPAYEVCR